MAFSIGKNKSLLSVPTLVKYNYLGRIIFFPFLLIPVFIVFRQRNLDLYIYLLFLSQLIIWPHLAYYLALISKYPKEVETKFTINAESIIFGIWLPICLFNPMVCVIGLIGVFTAAMMGGGGIPLVIKRTVSLVSGGIFGGIIFGFHFNSEITLSLFIWGSIAILIGNLFTIILFARTNNLIIITQQKLRQQKDILDKELAEAADYVKKVLPLPIHEGPVRIDWKFIPSASLGGDSFGYQWLDRDYFIIYLLDVSGHGVGAALLSVSILNALRSQSLPNTNFKEPKSVLTALNLAFPSDENNDMFFTFWYGVYNSQDRKLTFASAGHPPALLFESESKPTMLKTDNFVIGGIPNVSYKQKVKNIENKASLFVFSDGVYEIEKENGSMLSFSEYQTMLSDFHSDTDNSFDNLYDQTLNVCKRERFEDDYTILKTKFI